jgi:ubiquinone/menaquinone biosynthesis C-methylase UbiE
MVNFHGSLPQLVEYIRSYPAVMSELMSLFEQYDLDALVRFFDHLDLGVPHTVPARHPGYLRYQDAIDELVTSPAAYSVRPDQLDQDFLNQEATVSAYSNSVEIFDETVARFLSPPREEVMRYLAPASGERILEFAIGPGSTFEYYRTDCSVVGIDLSPRSLAAAEAKCERLGLRHIKVESRDIQHTGLPSRSFDAVFAFCGLCVIANPLQAVREAGRVLTDEGRLVLYEPGFSAIPEVNTLLYLMQPIARVFGNIWFQGFPAYTVLYNSCLDIDGTLAAAGFDGTTIKWYDSPFNTVRLVSCRKAGA